jgi:hypothetical protein
MTKLNMVGLIIYIHGLSKYGYINNNGFNYGLTIYEKLIKINHN